MLNKKLVLCSALLLTSLGLATAAAASEPGFYLGAQGGVGTINYGNVNNSDINTDVNILSQFGINSSMSNTNHTSALAGRVFFGYQIDPTWSVEAGYTQFGSLNQTQTATFTLGVGPNTAQASESDKQTVKTNALDVVAKATLPLEAGFSLYGKAGLAYLTAKASHNVDPSDIAYTNQTSHKVLPTASIGLQYEVTPQLTADVSYTRIQKVGHTDLIQSTNFLGAGLAYHFG